MSGKLIMNALVMYDHQTRSLWSQFLSRAVEGNLKGAELDVVPLTQTDWGSWRALHPDTRFLDTDGRYRSDNYESYYAGGRRGVIGEANADDRIGAKELVLGVSLGGAQKAYPLAALRENPVVNDTVGSRPILIYHDAPSGTALVYDRVFDGETLTFRLEGEPNGVQTVLRDEETGARWMAFSGLATEGEPAGRALERAPSHLSFWFAWTDWNPGTELFDGRRE